MLHKNVGVGDNHPIFNWTPADDAALAALVITSADVGKVAFKLDDKTFHILTDDSPVTWFELGTGGGGGSGGDMLSTDLSAEVPVTGVTVLTASAFGKMHVCSGTTADYTVTLPAVSGNAGKKIGFRMSSALTKLVTIDGNASETIDGQTSRILWAQEVAILYCDGTTWTKIAGKSRPMHCWLYKAASQTGIVTGTITKVLLDTANVNNTAAMMDVTNNRIDIKRPGNYLLDASVWTDPTGRTISRNLTYVYKNNAELTYSDAPQHSGGYSESRTPHLVFPLVAGDYIDLRGLLSFSGGAVVFTCVTATRTRLQLLEIPDW